jgi:hypothetical protein
MSDRAITTTKTTAPGVLRRLAAWPLAPLHALERARGRWRLLLLLAYGLVLLAVGLWLYRASRLRDLPDVGEPFDVAPLLAFDLPDERNAYRLYDSATAAAKRHLAIEERLLNPPYAWPAPSDEAAHNYINDNAEAMNLWLRATALDDALFVRPRDLNFQSVVAPDEHRHFARMGVLLASGCRARGDLDGAWTWYRGVLRASRHAARHGCIVARQVSGSELGMAMPGIRAWAKDPRTTAPLLRRALDDLAEIDRLTPPPSEALRLEYLVLRKALADPERLRLWYVAETHDLTSWLRYLDDLWAARFWLENEPERTRRLTRLAFTNWLRHIDDPPAARPPVRYDDGPRATGFFDGTADSRETPPIATIQARIQESFLARELLPGYDAFAAAPDRDWAARDSLKLALAEQLYLREQGRAAPTFGTLVAAGYLDHLPDGVEPDDPPLSFQLQEAVAQ